MSRWVAVILGKTLEGGEGRGEFRNPDKYGAELCVPSLNWSKWYTWEEAVSIMNHCTWLPEFDINALPWPTWKEE